MKRCHPCRLHYSDNHDYCGSCGSPLQALTWFERNKFVVVTSGVLIAVGVLLWISAIVNHKLSAKSSVPAGAQTVAPAPSATPDSKLRLARAQTSIKIGDFDTAKIQIEFITPKDPEYAEAQRLKPIIQKGVAVQAQKRRETERQRLPNLRETLRLEYEQVIADANPHLNFIGSKITTVKGGYALWATHEYFSQYTFTIGNDAKVVQAWITSNEARLKEAGIVRVGVMGRGSYASWGYFDLR